MNGVEYRRGSNTLANVLPGITLTLVPRESGTTVANGEWAGARSARITVSGGSDAGTTAVQGLVRTYNAMLASYQSLTKASVDPTARGTLAGESSLTNFMSTVKRLFDAGAMSASGTTISWSAAGVSVQRDGSLAVDGAKLSAALAGDLGKILAEGLHAGSNSGSSDLRSFVDAALRSGGVLGAGKSGQDVALKNLQTERTRMSDKLDRVKARYLATYSALDAQLTQMNQVSQSLASALDGLMASNNK